MQMENNQKSYAARGWSLYPDGAEIPDATSKSQIVPIDDWIAGEEPAWTPIAGGKGFGTPERSKGGPPALYPGQSTENAAYRGSGGGSNSSTTEVSPSSTTAALSSSVTLSASATGTVVGGAPILHLQNSTSDVKPQTSDSSTSGPDTTVSDTTDSDITGADITGSVTAVESENGDECEAEL